MAITGEELTDDAPVGETIASVTRRRTPVRVPASRYTSPEWAALEDERLWPSVWQLACTRRPRRQPRRLLRVPRSAATPCSSCAATTASCARSRTCAATAAPSCAPARATGSPRSAARYHRWTWDLAGRLREVPSRKGFGVLRNDDYAALPGRGRHLGPVRLRQPRHRTACRSPSSSRASPTTAPGWGSTTSAANYSSSSRRRCNWKTLIDGFSETYHVQGIHREMLADGRRRQLARRRSGSTTASSSSPTASRARGCAAAPTTRPCGRRSSRSWARASAARWTATPARARRSPRAARSASRSPSSHGARPARRRASTTRASPTTSCMNMQQYNLFPNITVLVFPDLLQVVQVAPRRHARRLRSWTRSASTAARPATRRRARSRST